MQSIAVERQRAHSGKLAIKVSFGPFYWGYRIPDKDPKVIGQIGLRNTGHFPVSQHILGCPQIDEIEMLRQIPILGFYEIADRSNLEEFDRRK